MASGWARVGVWGCADGGLDHGASRFGSVQACLGLCALAFGNEKFTTVAGKFCPRSMAKILHYTGLAVILCPFSGVALEKAGDHSRQQQHHHAATQGRLNRGAHLKVGCVAPSAPLWAQT